MYSNFMNQVSKFKEPRSNPLHCSGKN